MKDVGLIEDFRGVNSVWENDNFDLFPFEIEQNTDGFFVYIGYKWIQIRHVHELQNLYVDVKGKELKFTKISKSENRICSMA